MDFDKSGVATRAEHNARLLVDLMATHSAAKIGSISNFFYEDIDWVCPCCARSKMEIARRDKNGFLHCALHWHHDHFGDMIRDAIPELEMEFPFDITSRVDGRIGSSVIFSRFEPGFIRFEETLVCGDCNAADGAAKTIVGAPNKFSFAPHEIAGFICVKDNDKHTIIQNRAVETYALIRPVMKQISDRLRGVRRYVVNDNEEDVGDPAVRIIRMARAGNGPVRPSSRVTFAYPKK